MEVACLAWNPAAGEPLHQQWIRDYLNTGRQAYTDHYTHLWPGGDPAPYLSRNLTRHILLQELNNPAFRHWVVYAEGEPAGICKLDLRRESPDFHPGKALFLEKIYFLKGSTGQGLGSYLLKRIFRLARDLDLKGVWLESMQRGPALEFYRKHGFRILGTTRIPYPEVLPSEEAMYVLGKDI